MHPDEQPDVLHWLQPPGTILTGFGGFLLTHSPP